MSDLARRWTKSFRQDEVTALCSFGAAEQADRRLGHGRAAWWHRQVGQELAVGPLWKVIQRGQRNALVLSDVGSAVFKHQSVQSRSALCASDISIVLIWDQRSVESSQYSRHILLRSLIRHTRCGKSSKNLVLNSFSTPYCESGA